MSDKNCEEIFSDLLSNRESLVGGDLLAINSLRVMLRRKWDKYRIDMDRLGWLPGNMTSCILRSEKLENGLTRFWLGSKKAMKIYEIIQEDTPNENVHTNLATDQESSIRNGDSGESSQYDGEDSDPGSPEGEVFRSSIDEEDWRT